MICPKCGKNCADGSNFCDGCGTPFAAQQPNQQTNQQPKQQAGQQQNYYYNNQNNNQQNGYQQPPYQQNSYQQNGYQQKNNGGYQRQQAQPRQQYNNQRPAQPQPQVQAPDPTATLKATINSTNDVSALVSLYLDNTQVIEANPELKNLLTTRKKALQSLNAA